MEHYRICCKHLYCGEKQGSSHDERQWFSDEEEEIVATYGFVFSIYFSLRSKEFKDKRFRTTQQNSFVPHHRSPTHHSKSSLKFFQQSHAQMW